jgi:hypothetical protein
VLAVRELRLLEIKAVMVLIQYFQQSRQLLVAAEHRIQIMRARQAVRAEVRLAQARLELAQQIKDLMVDLEIQVMAAEAEELAR